MANNVIQLIYNVDGSLIDKVNSFISSNNQAANTIQVITPHPSSDSLSINYYLRNARITNYTQYLRLLKDREGQTVLAKDIVSPLKPYYQMIKDWYVWQIPISSKALRAISKYHSGMINVSVTIREFKNFLIEETMRYKGSFGSAKSDTRGDIPIEGIEDGDFYRCDYLDFYSTNAKLEFTLLDLAIWDDINLRWIKGSSYEEIMTTPTIELGVDPSVFGMAITDVEPSLTEQILMRISDLESMIMSETPESILSNMFIRRNLELYYAQLTVVDNADKIYMERGTNGFYVTVSDLLSEVDLTAVQTAVDLLRTDLDALYTLITSVVGDLEGSVASLDLRIDDIEAELVFKADLIGGTVPIHQLPSMVTDSVTIIAQEDTPINPKNNLFWIDTDEHIVEPLGLQYTVDTTGDNTQFVDPSQQTNDIDTTGDNTQFVDPSQQINDIDTTGNNTEFNIQDPLYDTSGNFIG